MKWAAAILFMCLVCALLLLASAPQSKPQERPLAQGFVFEDKNKNGRRDAGEPGLAGIRVSNQHEIVRTDSSGRWSLPYSQDHTIFFVIKPRGWMTPVDEHHIPRFYYIHKPAGSPREFKYKGVDPTGELPKSIDFGLYRRREPNEFTALFFGDTQPRDLREVEYIAKDIVEPLVGTKHGHSFGVTLGDIVFDDLSVMRPLAETIGLIGIPWYNVLGNHDINYDAADDHFSDETFELHFGPNYYSFDHGPTHFVVLDNVVWGGPRPSGTGTYRGGLGKDQLTWLRQDLALVPDNQLVVLMMHIPLTDIDDRQQLYRLIENRPFALSVSAHTHYQEHRMITDKDGWKGAKPHHHVVNVTTCGSWWQGAPDENGIPHTTMRCGAPNGYAIFTFNGNQYSIDFRAARRPSTYQLSIIAPDSMGGLDVESTYVYVNVFGGSEHSKVEMSVSGGPWTPMEKVLEPDPAYAAMVEKDKALARPYRPLPAAINSPHLWRARLRGVARRGVHPIQVRTTDMFGQTFTATKAIRVE